MIRRMPGNQRFTITRLNEISIDVRGGGELCLTPSADKILLSKCGQGHTWGRARNGELRHVSPVRHVSLVRHVSRR